MPPSVPTSPLETAGGLSMESLPELPQTILSPSMLFPHTMLSSSRLLPHTILSSVLPHTILSSPTVLPHTMLSPGRLLPHTILSAHAGRCSATRPLPSARELPQIKRWTHGIGWRAMWVDVGTLAVNHSVPTGALVSMLRASSSAPPLIAPAPCVSKSAEDPSSFRLFTSIAEYSSTALSAFGDSPGLISSASATNPLTIPADMLV